MRTVAGSNSLRLRHAPGNRPHLAVDLGGTRLRAALVDAEGHALERRIQPTPRDAPCAEALEMLARGLLDQGPVSGAVIGAPGRVDYAAGELEFAPNLPPGWIEELSQRYLTESLGVRISLANDADLAAVGEARFGAGRGHQDVVYMTVSTGIGAGVLLGGRLVRGRLSLAEVGHTVIDREALARAEPHRPRVWPPTPASWHSWSGGATPGRLPSGSGVPRQWRSGS